MQKTDSTQRRSQGERTDATRTALVSAARVLFEARGFAGTGTPEIVAAANVTRGALYHHFADKTEVMGLSGLAGFQALQEGLQDALGDDPPSAPLRELSVLLSAAFDRAALAIARGEPAAPYEQAVRLLLSRLVPA